MLVAVRGRVNSYYAKKLELSDKHAVIHEVQDCLLGSSLCLYQTCVLLVFVITVARVQY